MWDPNLSLLREKLVVSGLVLIVWLCARGEVYGERMSRSLLSVLTWEFSYLSNVQELLGQFLDLFQCELLHMQLYVLCVHGRRVAQEPFRLPFWSSLQKLFFQITFKECKEKLNIQNPNSLKTFFGLRISCKVPVPQYRYRYSLKTATPKQHNLPKQYLLIGIKYSQFEKKLLS